MVNPSNYLRGNYIKDLFQNYMAEGHFKLNSPSVAKRAVSTDANVYTTEW